MPIVAPLVLILVQNAKMKSYASGSSDWIKAMLLRNSAATNAKKIRDNNSHLSGILSAGSDVMTVQTFGYMRGIVRILVDKQSTVYYSSKCDDCTYSEEIHTQSGIEYWHGKVAKEVIDKYPLPTSLFTEMTEAVTVDRADIPKVGVSMIKIIIKMCWR